MAEQAHQDLDQAGLMIIDALGKDLLRSAAKLKVVPGQISIADCVGIALALELNAEFVTTDHHELDRLSALGTAWFLFIR